MKQLSLSIVLAALMLGLLAFSVVADSASVSIFALRDTSGSTLQSNIDAFFTWYAQSFLPAFDSRTDTAGLGIYGNGRYQQLAALGTLTDTIQVSAAAVGHYPPVGNTNLISGLLSAEVQLNPCLAQGKTCWILISGDGCTDNLAQVRSEVARIRAREIRIGYAQNESDGDSCLMLNNDVDRYWQPGQNPNPAEFRDYSLMTRVVGDGNVTKDPNQTAYHYGDVVSLTANASTGWTFANWSGAVQGITNPVTIMMDANKIVTGTFVPAGSPITGSLFASQNEITRVNTVVTYTIVLTNNGLVPAVVWAQDIEPLAVWFIPESITGPGSWNPEWSSVDISATLPAGDHLVVTFQARFPIVEYAHVDNVVSVNWSATGKSGTFNLNHRMYLYNPASYLVTVNIVGQGTVSQTNNRYGINCPNRCSLHYDDGDILVLAATAKPGYAFVGWTGSVNGMANPLTVDVNGDLVLTATFATGPADLSNSYKIASRIVITPDQTLTYAVVLRNMGAEKANHAYIWDNIPAGVTYISGSVTATVGTALHYDYQNQWYPERIEWQADVPAGGVVTMTYAVTVTAKSGVVTNRATLLFQDEEIGTLIAQTQVVPGDYRIYLPLTSKR